MSLLRGKVFVSVRILAVLADHSGTFDIQGISTICLNMFPTREDH